MATVVIKHCLADYSKRKTIFDKLKSDGWIGAKVFLDPVNHNTVVMVNSFKCLENAKAFMQSHELLDALEKASTHRIF